MSDDMITLPEDPNAPPPEFPRTGQPRLRDETTAEWVMSNGLTVRYNHATEQTLPVGVATRQQLSGWNFLRHDPVPPAHLTQAARDAHVAHLNAQAATFESMADAMRYARENAHGGARDGEAGALLAELWARFVAHLKRKKANDIQNQTVNP